MVNINKVIWISLVLIFLIIVIIFLSVFLFYQNNYKGPNKDVKILSPEDFEIIYLDKENLIGNWRSISESQGDNVGRLLKFHKNNSYYFKQSIFEERGNYKVNEDKIFLYSFSNEEYKYYTYALIKGDILELTSPSYFTSIKFKRVENA